MERRSFLQSAVGGLFSALAGMCGKPVLHDAKPAEHSVRGGYYTEQKTKESEHTTFVTPEAIFLWDNNEIGVLVQGFVFTVNVYKGEKKQEYVTASCEKIVGPKALLDAFYTKFCSMQRPNLRCGLRKQDNSLVWLEFAEVMFESVGMIACSEDMYLYENTRFMAKSVAETEPANQADYLVPAQA